ncbi:MAG: hypothetical protein LBU12_05375 [Deltaproteobacteria bacterium]|nr:hypothetical protein [Deltaproteobacteria bacterium]
MNYGRPENHWRRWAEACGAEFRDGLDMLACQARSSFAKWTGASPPLEPFLTAIRAWAAEGR